MTDLASETIVWNAPGSAVRMAGRPLPVARLRRARGGAALAERLADRVHRRPRRRAGRLLRVPRRPVLRVDRARRRRRAARVPERVPSPWQLDLPGERRGPHPDSLPVAQVDVGPERAVARGAVAQVVRRARQRRLPAVPGERRRVGAHRVREPRPRGAAAARVPRGHPRRHRVGRPRRVPLRGGHAHHGRLQLEGHRRRLRRDVSRAGPPSRDARFDGRHQHEATPLGAPRRVVPAVRRAEPAPRATAATRWCGTRSSRPRVGAWGPTTCTGARRRRSPRARPCST